MSDKKISRKRSYQEAFDDEEDANQNQPPLKRMRIDSNPIPDIIDLTGDSDDDEDEDDDLKVVSREPPIPLPPIQASLPMPKFMIKKESEKHQPICPNCGRLICIHADARMAQYVYSANMYDDTVRDTFIDKMIQLQSRLRMAQFCSCSMQIQTYDALTFKLAEMEITNEIEDLHYEKWFEFYELMY